MSGIPSNPTSEPKPATTAPATTTSPPATDTSTPKPEVPGSLLTDGVKPEAAKPEAKDGAKEPTKAGAPEAYTDFKAPEGFEIDSEFLTKEAIPIFKELGLSQEGAQKLIDLQMKHQAKAQEAVDAPYKLWNEQQEKWITEIKSHPEIGSQLDKVKSTVSRVIDGTMGPELGKEFREALNFTGGGNNPAIIRGLYKLSQKLSEGTPVTGRGPAFPNGGRPASAAQALYPDLPQG